MTLAGNRFNFLGKVVTAVLLNVVLWAIVMAALYKDLQERRIPNKLLLTGVALGLGLHLYNQGMAGLIFGIKGFLVGLAIFFLPFAMGGLGAGDVKLLGTIGLLKGTSFVIVAAIGTGLFGGILAVGLLLKQKRLLASLKRIGQGLYIMLTGKSFVGLKTLDQAEYSEALPYGLAIALGTLGAALVV